MKKVSVISSSVNSDAKYDIKYDKKHVNINSETKSAANANKIKKAKGSKKSGSLKLINSGLCDCRETGRTSWFWTMDVQDI